MIFVLGHSFFCFCFFFLCFSLFEGFKLFVAHDLTVTIVRIHCFASYCSIRPLNGGESKEENKTHSWKQILNVRETTKRHQSVFELISFHILLQSLGTAPRSYVVKRYAQVYVFATEKKVPKDVFAFLHSYYFIILLS